jgi:amino acid transporter
MKHITLENELKNRIKKRRIIIASVCALFFLIAIIFMIAYDGSREIKEIGEGIISYRTVTYNHDFAWGILIGWLLFSPLIVILIADLIFSKTVTVKVGEDHITFYRGLAHTSLYVNGEYKDGLSYGYHLEAPLSDGTKVYVALGKWSAHLTFSNGHPPIDI